MSDPSASMIIVDYRDRFARLGAEHPTAALPVQDRRFLAGDHGHNHDPVRDIIEVLTSMCARRYGHSRAMRAVTATTQDVPELQVK
ncbi:hypothetical protein MWU77_24310 [Rhodococcus sp. F64268]|uniref:hypothetical protein n=1 Tax=Rhodococcus sp. F64268 TaxID=2926402 RepID=UPI001FF5371E|nr:hypothetical protein [Rhodococcus sp. F64268]MCK0093895.1 hypothetical protein [Rhodococcus sp. F64268]